MQQVTKTYETATDFLSQWGDMDMCYNQVTGFGTFKEETTITIVQPRRDQEWTITVTDPAGFAAEWAQNFMNEMES